MKKIPPFKLEIHALNKDAEELIGFKWADESVGKRHKLGGQPDFIYEESFPKCDSCGKEMVFYGQLDSIGDNCCIADCGMIFTFLCFDCFEVKSIVQSS